MESRDRREYRHKGRRKTVIKTVMGEVEYSRAIYEREGEDGTKEYEYLLDKAMGITGSGFMSGNLTRQIVEAACAGTYRRAAQSVSEMTGQTISHTGAWKVVQEVGERVGEHELEAAELAEGNKGRGEVEARVLFEEQDGIWLHMQGRSRKKHGKSKELKVAIAYDGAEKCGKKRYRLTNKVATANFEGSEGFFRRKEGKIAETYCVDEIGTRILNGDGASWIKRSVTDETVCFQLDPFHRNKAIHENVSDPEMKDEIFRQLYSLPGDLPGQTESLLAYIEALSDSVADDKEREKLKALHGYFASNRDGLADYRRRGIDLPDPPEGKEYRCLGAMESNIFTIIGNRMKGGRACWSVDGGNNLARFLTLKHTGRLRGALESLTSWFLPQKHAEEVMTEMSAASVPKREGKGFEPVRGGAFPATPGFKFMREIGRVENALQL
jgi:hypothetical protein